MTDTYRIHTDPNNRKQAIGCIDLVESEDDGGWYAHEYDFDRTDNATRVSAIRAAHVLPRGEAV